MIHPKERPCTTGTGRRLATRVVRTVSGTDARTGASSVPIYQASTFHHASLENPPEHDYTRSGNPTRQALEDTIAQLEGGARGFAFSSGMAAISTAFMLLSNGDHVICSEDVYGGTYRLLTTILGRMGIETTFVDATDLDRLEAARRPNTRAVFLETPSNPTLKITGIAAVAEWARKHGLLTMLDNTFMTPCLQRPIELGIDIVVHSATKFLGGHSDVLAGLAVVSNERLGHKLKHLQNGLGSVLGVQDSWLLMRGMKTLLARMECAERSARQLADWLTRQPSVTRVYYPGLPEHPGRAIHERQSQGYGAIVSFDVGSGARARKVLEHVTLPLVAVSLGAVESILSYPALMSHAAMPREIRLQRGIGDGLLRYSVGLEALEDILGDLEQALHAAR
ncbi:MAG TPA: aminotransferase class I/II-fold pyridoxal phosphate-dependent enzyme [Archangium sp.]|uniref:trans-sulfuration enzyme family protein n=1 Tax=Archangium sp. TaxID=1872627 RepID=UPI002E35D643|nr:aminotransferase class I/II-fold pyridoxal phosphate-dependent enzyme [Archangium sp.]HEX5750974.1 aminotransferase class I/II-fold pyridoxal phosphate-dependent enzyme [Archangium sp.]